VMDLTREPSLHRPYLQPKRPKQ